MIGEIRYIKLLFDVGPMVLDKPARRKGNNDRTTANMEVEHIEMTLPVSSGLRSSIELPLATTIS